MPDVKELKEENLACVVGGKLIPCDRCGCNVIPDKNGKYTCNNCGYSNKNL